MIISDRGSLPEDIPFFSDVLFIVAYGCSFRSSAYRCLQAIFFHSIRSDIVYFLIRLRKIYDFPGHSKSTCSRPSGSFS